MDMNEKIYFQPGDIVTLRQDLPNKPIMYVVKKETSFMKEQEGILKGIRCRWFANDGKLEEAVFNTKDLIFV